MELSFEEKERINQRLFDIANKMAEVDENNKSWILQMVTRVRARICSLKISQLKYLIY